MIGRSGERWSGISVLAARHDDDDDDDTQIITAVFLFQVDKSSDKTIFFGYLLKHFNYCRHLH